MIKRQNEIYLNSTLSYCSSCNRVELSRIMARENGVFLERLCPIKGTQSIKIIADYKWYIERVCKPQKIYKVKHPEKSKFGCPFDCGICEWHTGAIKLPIFSITNNCNLDCHKCFTYNRPDKKYYKSIADTKRIINHIVEKSDGVQLINLTGGEPTLHPDLFNVIDACKHNKIERITMNTNGLRIADDISFAKKIKDSGVQLVLSLDTFDPEKSVKIHGRDITEKKKKALRIIESLNIPVTILSVCIKGINEQDVLNIVSEYIKKDFVCSITIQNMTYTGKRGSQFKPYDHITIDEVEKLLESCGEISQNDFFSLASYHPLCYSVAYYIVYKNKILSLTKIIDKEILTDISEDCYLLDLNRDLSRYFMDGINRLWAEGEDEEFIKELKLLVKEVYTNGRDVSAKKRRELIEKMVKMIYIHPHMDEANFDIDRVSRCGDLVPDETGKMIPACSYNLLYRQKDPRFWTEQ